MNEKNIFYPRVKIRKWENFRDLIGRSHVRVYWKELNWAEIILQVYDGHAVYYITQPEYNPRNKKHYIFGEVISKEIWCEELERKAIDLEWTYGFMEGEITDDIEM